MSEKRTTKQVEYREQTEDDLNSVPPMSKTQKAVLAGAALLVVVAAIYIIFL